MYFHHFVIISHLALLLNKLESPSPKDALCQVWLKLAQWFWRRRWKCEKFTDRRMDGQTTDDRWPSFQLRWAKNLDVHLISKHMFNCSKRNDYNCLGNLTFLDFRYFPFLSLSNSLLDFNVFKRNTRQALNSLDYRTVQTSVHSEV